MGVALITGLTETTGVAFVTVTFTGALETLETFFALNFSAKKTGEELE